MALEGMDIEHVRQLASQLNSAADQIQGLRDTLTSSLDSTSWVGPDYTRFRSEWDSTHVQQLQQVINAMHDASNTATQNASQQEQASNA